MPLADYFGQLLATKNILKPLQTDLESSQLITGLERTARSLLLAGIQKELKGKMVWVVADLTTAQAYRNELQEILAEDMVYLYAVEDIFHTQLATSSSEMLQERLEALHFIREDRPGIIVTTVAGFLKPLIPATVMQNSWQCITLEDKVDSASLIETLTTIGYQCEQIVARPGEFSVRGGIIDIYPVINEWPIRLELFGDEIDSMREFDPQTQRSIRDVDYMELSPATDFVITPKAKHHALEQLNAIREKETIESKKEITSLMEHIEAGIITKMMYALPELFYDQSESILDYLPMHTPIIFDEYTHLMTRVDALKEEVKQWQDDVKAELPFLIDHHMIHSFKKLYQKAMPRLLLSSMKRGLTQLKFTQIHDYHYRQMHRFFGQLSLIKEELQNFEKMKFTTIIAANSKQRAQELQEMLKSIGFMQVAIQEKEIVPQMLQIVVASLQSGYEWLDEKFALLTEADLFNQMKRKIPRSPQIDHAERIKAHNELNPGDYVVHIHHGIGKYLGIQTMEVRGIKQDYLTILYQNHDKLYVPVSQLQLVQKYVSSEGASPKIHKLGGTRWAKTKASVSKQVEDIADELIDLYAERQAKVGYAFSPTDAYYHEFEEAFPYVETPDQLRSIEEVNKDLEKIQPMDRLLVGDVGYGKTEVAVRAAFRTVQEGKQVAFLVPTTVLAQQHYNSFVERFIDFPVRIGLLSRFLTPKETQQTLHDLKKGRIDIVIGTHRLLSSDVQFHDLGLVVVDEEQRFGVKHKEKLKALKAQVDVLTLTATPIPRTLHMSIVGARDLSIIETPPANRYPVQTYVTAIDPMIIRDAIQKEMSRGGQVFYLHNRVQSMPSRVAFLEELIPEARIAYAHGQMAEHQLEKVLYDFINGEYDVLVTTTIIETGVDIPNVNTLLIEDADRLGLSQLYQLRGRVGRNSRIAYAYLMYRPDRVLTEESEQRLKAIQDFTELGSGFKIAMRDLSIRGAGNLLGKQQHGFIDSVGFDLYSQMLAEAVAKKQGKPKEKRSELEIDLEVEAYLPEDYISDSRQKIEIYQRIRSIRDDEEYFDLQDELIDRFGDYPEVVGQLLLVGLLKNYGELALVQRIVQKNQQISVEFTKEGAHLPIEMIFKALKDIPLKTSMDMKEKLTVVFHIESHMPASAWLEYLVEFTKNIAIFHENKNGK
ncbi:transcription-repair coupling factor [Allofustis seminis]|uniref:transcription-repair coupling factor n=1 Tax=Allofustis seminis TaxID=166939 RepID=UPI000382562E|nr:transcription-repair coupling factor [Allofustis seminis]